MSITKRFFRKIFPTVQAKRVKPWLMINGDKTYRLDYDLDENSVVFDLGGYEGQWASDIFSKFRCTVFVFEPYRKYATNIQNRFSRNSHIKVFDFGLGKEESQLTLYSNDDSSSIFKKHGQAFTIDLKKASDFIGNLDIDGIDLMKINIEGGEYDLLEELISSNSVKKITNIQVQFHDFVPDAFLRMKEIQNSLSKTHDLTYQFEFVWENWKLKK